MPRQAARTRKETTAACPAAEARDLLRRAGLRATAQRCTIAWLLTTSPSRHVTIESIHAAATKAKSNIALSSVYNIFRQFTDAGILRQRTFPDGSVIYDTDVSDHQHVLVEETGEILNLEGPPVAVGELPPIPEGYALDGVELLITVRQRR